VLDKIIEKADIRELEDVDGNFLKIVLYDLLISKTKLGGGKLLKGIKKHSEELKSALNQLLKEQNATEPKDLLSDDIKRSMDATPPFKYLRINLKQVTMPEAIDYFKESFPLLDEPGEGGFAVDKHISHLLVFPPQTDLHEDDWFQEGKFVIQDKASCFPPFLLQPKDGDVVIDGCSAPGNKTTFLAASHPEVRVLAVEKDSKRVELLKKMVRKSKCTNISVHHADFLSLDDSSPWNSATHVLLDPSCSGTGMIGTHDVSEERVTKLASFQKNALCHAMTFPRVETIIYSTCSIHEAENESVVRAALEYSKENELGWRLQHLMPEWSTRGVGDMGEKMMRTDIEKDRCIGFFVAKLTRPKPNLEPLPLAPMTSVSHTGEQKQGKKKRGKRTDKPVVHRPVMTGKGKRLPITMR
jgi:putative methyltransferase